MLDHSLFGHEVMVLGPKTRLVEGGSDDIKLSNSVF